MLTFENLTRLNWAKYKDFVLSSESLFPEVIRTPEDEYIHILRARKTVLRIALLDGEYIGHAIGYKPAKDEMSFHGLNRIYKDNNLMYLFGFVIIPEQQGKGYGKKLVSEFINGAKEKKFKKIVGHFRQNSSLNIIKKFGAKEIKLCKNWEDTGEDYVLCELDI